MDHLEKIKQYLHLQRDLGGDVMVLPAGSDLLHTLRKVQGPASATPAAGKNPPAFRALKDRPKFQVPELAKPSPPEVLPAGKMPPTPSLPSFGKLEEILDYLKTSGLHTKNGEPFPLVPPRGPAQAAIAVVSLVPSAEDQEAGVLFSGEDGQLLIKMLSAIGLDYQQVYHTSVVKNLQLNQKIYLIQKDRHLEVTFAELALTGCRKILLLGEKCAQLFLRTGHTLLQMRQKSFSLPGSNPLSHAEIFTLDHPQRLLRSPEGKQQAWKDLQWIRTRL